MTLSDSIRSILNKYGSDMMALTREFDEGKIESLTEFGKQRGILTDTTVNILEKTMREERE